LALILRSSLATTFVATNSTPASKVASVPCRKPNLEP
jgi:hypothetical protein